MANPSWPYPIAVTIGPDRHATIRLSDGTDYLLVERVTLYEDTVVPVGVRVVEWLRANPLKTQAALALLAGAVPETLRQLLVILL